MHNFIKLKIIEVFMLIILYINIGNMQFTKKTIGNIFICKFMIFRYTKLMT